MKISPKEIVRLHQKNGGCTVNPVTGRNFGGFPGYAVSTFKNKEQKYGNLSEQAVSKYIEDNEKWFSHNSKSYALGTWHNDEDGFDYLDIVWIESNLQCATNLGESSDQIAIYDLKNGEVIFL